MNMLCKQCGRLAEPQRQGWATPICFSCIKPLSTEWHSRDCAAEVWVHNQDYPEPACDCGFIEELSR